MTIKETITRLIDQDIYTNASTMVQDLTNEGSHWVDDLVPCLSAPDYSEPPGGYSVHQEHHAKYTEWVVTGGDDDIMQSGYDTEREAIQAAYDHAGEDPDYVEALQHWLVSDYLADVLEEVGALVARDVLGFNVWGRTECGQSLTMDSDLYKVAELIEARLANR